MGCDCEGLHPVQREGLEAGEVVIAFEDLLGEMLVDLLHKRDLGRASNQLDLGNIPKDSGVLEQSAEEISDSLEQGLGHLLEFCSKEGKIRKKIIHG
ncbi:unnamed protein product [Bursaphelenchus xylophilus]|uniref:(pine wood nematode) hypothetical protein n=1 Tax=Bursaphelenchus xylophilus TaxID=6326 RepID=A0A811K7Q0_BURXY|nr:unnamed protein product [Bursaphelenchus xylophilus]CAG9087581.1 unnamed protein product [Bursaphelenchus xylophilus]